MNDDITFDLDLVALDEVSLTRRTPFGSNGAANQHADVLIWKSNAQKEVGMPGETQLEKMAADLAKSDAALAETKAEVERLTKALAAKDTEISLREKDLAAAKAELDREIAKHADPDEALLKMMPEAAQKAFLAQKAATEKLEKRLAEADEQAKLAEIAKGFDADYSGLPVTGTDAAPVLKAAYTVLDEDQAALLRKMLKAGSDALAELTKIKGIAAHGVRKTSVEESVEKMARERSIEKGITFEKAYAAIISENPALYAQIAAANSPTH